MDRDLITAIEDLVAIMDRENILYLLTVYEPVDLTILDYLDKITTGLQLKFLMDGYNTIPESTMESKRISIYIEDILGSVEIKDLQIERVNQKLLIFIGVDKMI